MFQEASDHRFDANVVRQTGNAGAQAADAAHHQFDRHAGPRCRIERVDDLGVDQRIHLHPDGSGLALPREGDLTLNVIEDALAQRQRRYRHLLDVARFGIAGDVIEDTRRVATDDRVRGEVRQVGVDARGDRMIIAGASVNVSGQAAAFATHDQ